MHICFITSEFPKPGFPNGGIGTFVATLGKLLVDNGVKVSVIGLNSEGKEEIEFCNGIQVFRLNPKKGKGLQWYFNSQVINTKIDEVHKVSSIDIVETSELGLAFISKIKGIKYVIRLHGGHHFFAEAENRGINWWKGFQEKRSFKKADAFIAVSKYVRNHTAKYLSYHNKTVKVIFSPIDISFFKPIEMKQEANNVTFVGTICEKKGVRQLIQSFPYIKEKNPDMVLNLYGRDWFYPDGSSYIGMLKAKELPLIAPYDKDVIFHGAVDYENIPNIYAKASVCVFPSHMETLGLVAPEAMAMEKPVVFTCLGPGPEVIEDGIDGFLVNPHNPKSIADKINKIFENSDRSIMMGKNARASVVDKFNPDQIVAENIAFYKQLI